MSRGVTRVLAALLILLAGATAAAAQNPADEAWEAGELERARDLYAERLADDSSDVRALHRLALIHGWNQEYEESIDLFDRLLEIDPSNTDARIARARVFAWRGDTDRAIQALESILDDQPDHVPALETLATFRSWAGHYTRALEIFDRIGEIEPDNRTVRYQRARVLAWADRFADARAVYDSLLATDPEDTQALLGLAQVLAWNDRLDSARAVYRRALEVDEGSLEALTGLARTSGYAGDLIEAEARWREIVEANPGSYDALTGLGRVLRWQGREAAAKPYLERAVRVEPNASEAREQLRWIHAALGPRVAPALAYEWDSDGNNIYTVSGHASVHVVPRVELRVDAYRRGASLGAAVPDARWTTGTTVTGSVQLSPGWRVTGSVGGGVPDSAGVDGTATIALVVASPARYRIRGTLKASRELLDATALLMTNRVVYDQLQLNAGTRLGRWTLEGGASAAWFESRVTSNGNRRLAGNAVASRPVTPWLDLGGSVRVFGFDQDLTEGYFDPDLYALLEVPASANTRLGPLDATLAVVPGLQQITTNGDIKPAFRTTGSLAWQRAPGQDLSVSLLYAANGASPFAQEAAGYRYFALNLRVRWVF